MIKIAVTTTASGEHAVWVMLDDNDFNPDPANRGESFIIGAGETLSEALLQARVELEGALNHVRMMAHGALVRP